MELRRAVASGALIAVLAALFTLAPGASAAGDSLRIDPPTSSVGKGDEFTVKVLTSASVPVSGASATVTFDKGILQVASVTRGTQFANSPLFLAADGAAIAQANRTGKLANVAAAFFPPGSVPAGDQEFLIIGFRAVACGTSNLGLPVGPADAGLLDGRANAYGNALKVTTTRGKVTVCPGGAGGTQGTPPPTTESAAPSESASSEPLPEASDDGGVIVPPEQPSAEPAASEAPSPSPSPEPGLVAASGGPLSPEQDAWLTFSLSVLGVAAAALAVCILLAGLAIIVAGTAGAIIVIRYWRASVHAGDPIPGDAATTAPPVASDDTQVVTTRDVTTLEPARTPY